MMRVAILAGTGIYDLQGVDRRPIAIETPYGSACYHQTDNPSLIFLPRHGLNHNIPPHAINYRANFWALHQLGVHAVLATYAVGSLHRGLAPRELTLITDFLDCTRGRADTFYEGGDHGVGHADMTAPYCPALRAGLQKAAERHNLVVQAEATYACTQGPRFESPAEVKMLANWGGDVVGMTGVPEVCLARELGIHFAAVGLSINLAIGIEVELQVVHDLQHQREGLMNVFAEVANEYMGGQHHGPCNCVHAVEFLGKPKNRVLRAERK